MTTRLHANEKHNSVLSGVVDRLSKRVESLQGEVERLKAEAEAEGDGLTLSLRDILVAQTMLRRRLMKTRPAKLGSMLLEKLGRISDNFNGRR